MDSIVSFFTWVIQNPTSKEYAAVLLLAAIVVNFALGNAIALVRGQWSFNRWGDLVATKIDVADMRLIFKTIGGTLAAAAVAAYASGHIDITVIKQLILPALVTAAAAEAGLYSSKIWYEDIQQARDLINAVIARLTGKPQPVLFNLSQVPAVKAKQLPPRPPADQPAPTLVKG